MSQQASFTPPEFANRMLDTLAEAWRLPARDHQPLRQRAREEDFKEFLSFCLKREVQDCLHH